MGYHFRGLRQRTSVCSNGRLQLVGDQSAVLMTESRQGSRVWINPSGETQVTQGVSMVSVV